MTLARLIGSATLVTLVVVALWRMWAWARYESGGGKPMSGLPIVMAWGITLLVIPIVVLILLLLLIPWDAL